MTIILLLVGLGLIVLGADWLVDGASAIARRAGVSEFVSCVMLLLWAYTGRKCRIDRWEGALMLLAFAAYYYYLFVKL